MKALFLAEEKGYETRPLTGMLLNTMVPMMNKPLLERTMACLRKTGITEIVICLSGRQDCIKNYFGNGEQFGLHIQYIIQNPLDTEEGTEQEMPQFNETFIALDPDILSDIDIQKMIELHKSRHAIATIAVTRAADSPEKKNRLELVSPHYLFAGVYIVEPEITAVPAHGGLWFEKETFKKTLEQEDNINIFKNHDYWIDIETVDKYKQAHLDILSNKCTLADYNGDDKKISLGKNVRIHPTAKISGGACIGDNVQIGAMVRIRNSVIGSNSFIGFESTIIESILWNNVTVSSNVRLNKTVVTEGSLIPVNMNYINSVVSEEKEQLVFQRKDVAIN